MNVVGIVAEYNPFHNGHLYHLNESKKITESDVAIAVMSGNFVQRGEISMADKYTRTRMALLSGIDLVIELPVIFACNNAEQFAKGAIQIFEGLSAVNFLSFGAESEDLDFLKNVAKTYAISNETFKKILRKKLDEKLSYPRAMTAACAEYLSLSQKEIGELSAPNNILAIEYLKQLVLSSSKITPLAIKRRGNAYNDTELNTEYASAKAIRVALSQNIEISKLARYLPAENYDILNKIDIDVKSKVNKLYEIFAYRILTSSAEELSKIYAMGEGIENRIIHNIRYSNDFDSLTEKIISKRYTRARIQRLYMQTILGITKQEYEHLTNTNKIYARVLGFTKKGAEFLHEVKKQESSKIPIITNINKQANLLDEDLQKMISYDIKATDIYNIISSKDMYANSDFVRQPIVI